MKWRCTVCNHEVTGDTAPVNCPVCSASAEKFIKIGNEKEERKDIQQRHDLHNYLSQWARPEYEIEEKYSLIQKLSVTGKSDISPMGTRKPFPGLDTILFRGAQFSRFPLNENDPVSTKTVIGAVAKEPLVLDIPFFVSHMSFGALSIEAKIALAKGATAVGTAIGSGEGGMHPEERKSASKYIYEVGTAQFSYDEEAISRAEAVEIKFGQAAKPGMGGHLPAEKISPEIAAIRKLSQGQDFISPNRQPAVNSQSDLKAMVDKLRTLSNGKPVGIKFAAGHVEKDLEYVLATGPDFITIDCRGGSTGAAPAYIRDHVCLPPIYAIRRARRYLGDKGSPVTLCVCGGFRDSTDIAKALALGANAVALATSSLIAIGCQQYRICNTGKCPVGITTQDPELRARLSVELSRKRFENFYNLTREELETLARINGRSNVHDLDLSDIFTISNEVAVNTDIHYA